jgi:hypothetical protein
VIFRVRPRPVAWAHEVVDLVSKRAEEPEAARNRPDAGIVVRELFGGVDARVRSAAGGPVELVNIATAFVEEEPSSLTGAVGKDDNVSRHDKTESVSSALNLGVRYYSVSIRESNIF